MLLTISYVVAGLLLILCIYLSVTTKLLRNASSNPNVGYSFSRVQLMWWTTIISCSYIILFAKTGDYNLFNNSVLVLLGIGVVTSASASVIDVSQNETGNELHQHKTTQSFFVDILSNKNGIAMSRLQAVIFNVLFGIIFIVVMWTQSKFPEFNNSQQALMGISSGTYLALKTNENKIPNTPQKVVNNTENHNKTV